MHIYHYFIKLFLLSEKPMLFLNMLREKKSVFSINFTIITIKSFAKSDDMDE